MRVFIGLLAVVAASVYLGLAAAQRTAQQIEEALLPLPDRLKAGATVMALAADGSQTMLREGTSDFICMRDNSRAYFRVDCVDETVVPIFSAFARLVEEGLSEQDTFGRLRNLMRSGEVSVPPARSMVYVVAGPDQDNYEHISVVFLPDSRSATTGLSLEYSEGGGWLLCQGPPFAHIMVGPEPDGLFEGFVGACTD